MGVDGIDKADIFDEHFDNKKPKYIIRNCPCFNEGNPMLDYYGECLSLTDDTQVCQDCADCVMKQIVELCKENLNSLETYVDVRSLECVTLQSILQLLDIQEVE